IGCVGCVGYVFILVSCVDECLFVVIESLIGWLIEWFDGDFFIVIDDIEGDELCCCCGICWIRGSEKGSEWGVEKVVEWMV
ncbi:DEAD/DEAH box helicase, partial [Enterococcus hirae]